MASGSLLIRRLLTFQKNIPNVLSLTKRSGIELDLFRILYFVFGILYFVFSPRHTAAAAVLGLFLGYDEVPTCVHDVVVEVILVLQSAQVNN